VMHLALDWLCASGSPPEPGRSDNSGFGDWCIRRFNGWTFRQTRAKQQPMPCGAIGPQCEKAPTVVGAKISDLRNRAA